VTTQERDLNDLESRTASRHVSVVPDPDGAVYWSNDKDESGYPRNRNRGEAFCRESDGRSTTLEGTPDGACMDRLCRDPLYREDQEYRARADRLGQDLSRMYAEQTQGQVNTFVVGSRPESVFRSTELPRLLENETVTSINGVPREELDRLSHTEAFDRICEAELARDVQRAQVMEPGAARDALESDVAERRKTYEDWRDNRRAGEMEKERAQRAQEERDPVKQKDPGQSPLTPEHASSAPAAQNEQAQRAQEERDRVKQGDVDRSQRTEERDGPTPDDRSKLSKTHARDR
jgi:hypothetical protein